MSGFAWVSSGSGSGCDSGPTLPHTHTHVYLHTHTHTGRSLHAQKPQLISNVRFMRLHCDLLPPPSSWSNCLRRQMVSAERRVNCHAKQESLRRLGYSTVQKTRRKKKSAEAKAEPIESHTHTQRCVLLISALFSFNFRYFGLISWLWFALRSQPIRYSVPHH